MDGRISPGPIQQGPGFPALPGGHCKYQTSQGKIVLPINEALMLPAHALWQKPATIPATYKKADKRILYSS